MRVILLLLLVSSPCFAYENVAKERYSEAMLRQDSEVLVSKARQESRYYVSDARDSVIELKDKDDGIIIKTQLCDETSCTEWKDNNGE